MEHPISAALTTLQLDSPAEEHKTKQAFFRHVRSRLLDLLGQAGDGAREAFLESGAADHEGFLLAPEISHLAIHASPDQAGAVSEFLYKAVMAEAAKTTQDTGPFNALWSIRGDFFITKGAENDTPFVYQAPRILDNIAMDFNSPYCSFISNEELGAAEGTSVGNYEMEQFETMMELLHRALAPLQSAYPEAVRFIEEFTYHLIGKTHPSGDFSSGSNGLYIGRVVLCNIETTSAELIAEAFVHEAAHGYLYMLETLQPWMPSYEHSREIGHNVPSCWTGNHISLRSFSQAIFVWYTLWQFWKKVQARNLFRAEFVERRLQFIGQGFEKLDLSHLQKLAAGTIPPTSMDAFRILQSSILSSSTLQS